MTERILVTGGAGYIGSITTKELIESGFDVLVVDNLENGHREAVVKGAKLEVANVGDKKRMVKILKEYRPTAVIDFAAYLAVGESMVDPRKYFINNVQNFINLLDAMVESDCNLIVKSSTAAVYGSPIGENYFPLEENYTDEFEPEKSNLLLGVFDGKKVIGEVFFQKFLILYENLMVNRPELRLVDEEVTMLRIPTSVYGLTKLLDEIIMKKYDKLFGIRYVTLRYFNVAGADEKSNIGEDHPAETHIIPTAIQSIIKNTAFSLTGNDYKTKDGTAIRDYIHVIDLARAHLSAVEYLIKKHESNIFNLGSKTGYSVLEIIHTVENITGKKAVFNFEPRRQGDPEKLLASAEKAKAIMGWQTNFSLNDMISTAWKWHSSHPNGYR